MLVIFDSFIAYLSEGNQKKLFVAQLLLLFLGFYHPYDVFISLPVCVVFGFYQSLQQKSLRRLMCGIGALAAGVSPFFLYTAFVFLQEPLFYRWLQNPRLTPSFVHLVLGLAFLLPFSFVGLSQMGRSAHLRLCGVWVITAFLVAYAPLPFQRRLLEGLQIPLAFLAAPSLVCFSEMFRHPGKFRRLFFIFSSFSLISVYVIDLKAFAMRAFPYYYSDGFSQSLVWIKNHTPKESRFLSSFAAGSFIASRAGRTVFIGHQDQTLHLKEKEKKAYFFFREASCREKLLFMKKQKLNYLFVSVLEKELLKSFPCPGFVRIYQNGEVSIFKAAKGRFQGLQNRL